MIPDGRFACRNDMACQVTPFGSVDASSAVLALTGLKGEREGSAAGVIPKALETAPDMKLTSFLRRVGRFETRRVERIGKERGSMEPGDDPRAETRCVRCFPAAPAHARHAQKC